MKKRLLVGLLWFYATWYAWSVVAWATGISDAAGPIMGIAAAVLFACDPLRRIWHGKRIPAPIMHASTHGSELA